MCEFTGVSGRQARGVVGDAMLKERLEVDLLHRAGLVADADAFTKRISRINTAI
jgi:hypothetical protein